jgi:hypothetical protein
MGALVFVSTEFDPLAEGGAASAVLDMLRALPAADLKRTILCLVDCAADAASFASSFPDVRLVLIDTLADQDRMSNGRQHPPARAYSTTPYHWRSAVIFRALASLGEKSAIDYVEFPDRGGLAFCTLQERKLRNFLPDATIAVRLVASSYTQMMLAEAQVVDIERLNLSDLERKCLRDCDCVVTAVLPIAEETRRSFGFSVEEWNPRVIEHAYPVRLSLPVGLDSAVPASVSQTLVFPSTVRRVNRPDLFVRAVARFLSVTPAYTGAVILGTPGPDRDYASDIERLIPAAHVERFERMPPGPGDEREALLRNATVVIASSWDAFCPVAYEASTFGARLILNETNPAFGPGTPWQDGVNCLKFDGSVHGLFDALKRNIERNEHLWPVRQPTHPWPWLQTRNERRPWKRNTDLPLVSVVIAHYNLGNYLSETLASVRGQSYGRIEIVLIDDASADPRSVLAIEELARGSEAGLEVLQLPGNIGLAAARNIGVRHATGRYVLTLDADDLIHPDFIAVGVESLENRPEFDVVVTPAGYFLDGEPLPVPGVPVDFPDYAMFSGEAVVGGLIENRFSTATAFFRASALARFRYLESLSCYEDWSLYLRMCDAGIRFIVTNDVFFYYRRRRNSMVHTRRDPTRRRIEYSDLMRTSAPESLMRQSRHLIIGIASPVAAIPVAEPSVEAPEPQGDANTADASRFIGLFGDHGQYDEQVVFASLKLSRWAERKLPWLIHGSMWISSRAWRVYRALRG